MQDIRSLTNASFDHDDSINDRVEGGQLENGFFTTTRLWEEEYKHVSHHITIYQILMCYSTWKSAAH